MRAGAANLLEGHLHGAGLDASAVGKVLHGTLGNVEALAARGVDALDDNGLAVVGELPASAAERGVPLNAHDTAHVGEAGQRAEGGISCTNELLNRGVIEAIDNETYPLQASRCHR